MPNDMNTDPEINNVSDTDLNPEIYTVTIEALTTEGQGIARIAGLEGDDNRGFTVFCEGLLPGEEAEVRIVSRKKKYAVAECIRLITPSPERTVPYCPVYDDCGGCTLQHLNYDAQLQLKREHVVSCLTRIGKQPAETMEALTRPTIGMEHPYDYRNHMQYPVGETVTAARAAANTAENEAAIAAAHAKANPAEAAAQAAQAAAATQAAETETEELEAASNAPAAAAPTADAAPTTARDFKIGLYSKKSHTIVPHNACRIAHPACESVRRMTERFCLEKGILGYDEQSGHGLLRHLIVRVGYYTGEIMVILVVNSVPEKPLAFPVKEYISDISYRLEKDRKRIGRAQTSAAESAEPELLAAIEKPWKLKSVWVNFNPTGVRQGQVVSPRPQNQRLLSGAQYITDRIGANKFMISPLSFFQVNSLQTEKLYDTVRDFALGNLTPAAVAAMPATPQITITSVLDLYCGAGTIGLHLARYTGQLVGVESNEGAVQDARRNAAQNGATNATFIAAKVEEVPRSEIPYHPTLVILDPPRKGSEPVMLAKILVLNPEKIIYVSCDPATLARDIAVLTAGDYQIKAIQPVDMFPWSGHVETVVLMERK